MPVFAQVFGYTPDQYRALSHRDYAALRSHLVEQRREEDRAIERAKLARGER